MTADEIVRAIDERVWEPEDVAKFTAAVESLGAETEEQEISADHVVQLIESRQWTGDDYRKLSNATFNAQKLATEEQRYSFRRGQRVSFSSRGTPIYGVVERVNQKTATLKQCTYVGGSGNPYPHGVRVPLIWLKPA